jgi:hypothetical protein
MIARPISAVAVDFTLACRTDAIVEPTSSDRLAPTEPDLVLTGGVGTPIFPTAIPGEPQAKGFAIGLNGAGQVTGGAHDLFTSGDEGNKPFRWTPGGPLVKLTSCCENGFGADINASGVVVGSIEAGPNNAYRPFVARRATRSASFLYYRVFRTTSRRSSRMPRRSRSTTRATSSGSAPSMAPRRTPFAGMPPT